MSRIWLSLGAVSLLAPAAVYAEEASDVTPISLAEAVARATRQQPSVKAADARLDSAEVQVERAKVARRPTVDFSANSGAQPNRVAIGDTAFFRLGYSTSLSASMLLYDFGQSAYQIEATQASVDAAVEDKLDASTTVAFAAAQAYYNLWAAQQLLAISEAALVEAEARVKTAQALVDAGARAKIEVTRAAVDRSTASSELRRAQGELRQAQVALSIALGEPESKEVYRATEPPPLDAPPSLAKAYEQAQRARPDIAALLDRIEAQEAQLAASRAARRPILAARSSVSLQGPVVFEDETVPFVASFSAQLALTLPVYDGGAISANEATAKAELRAIQAQLDITELGLRSELADAYASYETAQASYDASQETVLLAEENQAIAKSRYEAGAGSAIEISDAAVSLTQAKRAALQDQMLVLQARLQIEQALGSASTLAKGLSTTAAK